MWFYQLYGSAIWDGRCLRSVIHFASVWRNAHYLGAVVIEISSLNQRVPSRNRLILLVTSCIHTLQIDLHVFHHYIGLKMMLLSLLLVFNKFLTILAHNYFENFAFIWVIFSTQLWINSVATINFLQQSWYCSVRMHSVGRMANVYRIQIAAHKCRIVAS